MIHKARSPIGHNQSNAIQGRDWLMGERGHSRPADKGNWGRGELVFAKDQNADSSDLSGTPASSADCVGKVYLFGAIRVISKDGVDCTPSGMFRKALFALILMGPRASRSRTVIQNMLWPGKHSSNLRTALSVLRRELKPLGEDLFEVTSQSISIKRDKLWVDVLDDPSACLKSGALENTELLEGLDLAGADIEDFEDWLRIERTALEEKLSNLGSSSPVAVSQGPSRAEVILADAMSARTNQLVPDFALMPVYAEDLSPLHTRMADSILDALGSSLKELCQCGIYDFRPENQRGFASPNGAGPDFLLGLSVVRRAGQLGLSLAVRDAADEGLVWEQTISGDAETMTGLDQIVVSGFVDQCCDRLAQLCESASFANGVRAGTPYQAINLMFNLDRQSVDQAGQLLAQSREEDGGIVFDTLKSYLDTIRIGENFSDGEAEDAQIEQVLKMVERLAKEPRNALAMTTAGYALDFLTGDRVKAHELLISAININPSQAFSWDHLAMFHFRSGEYDKAFNCAKRALHLGSHSPLRYIYETSLCMIATVRGDFRTSAFYGRRALAKSPDFAAALRYTAASLAFLERHEEASSCVDRMRQWEPNLSLEVFADRALVRNDARTCEQILDGLRKAGLN